MRQLPTLPSPEARESLSTQHQLSSSSVSQAMDQPAAKLIDDEACHLHHVESTPRTRCTITRCPAYFRKSSVAYYSLDLNLGKASLLGLVIFLLHTSYDTALPLDVDKIPPLQIPVLPTEILPLHEFHWIHFQRAL